MRHLLALITALSLGLSPAVAQDGAEDGGNSDFRDGAQLLTEGLGLIMRGLAEELEPLEEGWAELMTMLEDMALYHAPEILPNGDILIRRRVPLEPEPEMEPDPEVDPETGETDL